MNRASPQRVQSEVLTEWTLLLKISGNTVNHTLFYKNQYQVTINIRDNSSTWRASNEVLNTISEILSVFKGAAEEMKGDRYPSINSASLVQ